jgi:hypothetical protein
MNAFFSSHSINQGTKMDEHGFEARLRHLEHVLSGQQQSNSLATNESILKRVGVIQKELNTVYKNNKNIKEFVGKCKE